MVDPKIGEALDNRFEGGKDTTGDKFYLGCALNLCGCILVNGGTNLMKKGNTVQSRVIWYLGVVCFVGGNVFNFISFSMAPQSVLASLSAVQFVSNVFFAWFLLGEKITKRIIFATALIIGGVLVAVRNATHSGNSFTSKSLVEGYHRIQYTSYLGVQAISLVIMQLLYIKAPAGATYTPVCYAGVSAIIGTQSAVQAKCVSELIKARSTGKEENSYPWFPFVVGGLLLSSQIFWLVRMQKALKLFDGAIIIPMLQVFWTSFSILTGGLYFREFVHMTWSQVAFFLCGLVILFVGVYFLVPEKEGEPEAPESLDKMLRRTERASVFAGAGFVDIVDLASGVTDHDRKDRILRQLNLGRLSRVPDNILELSYDGARSLAKRPTEALHELSAVEEEGAASVATESMKSSNMVIQW